MDVLASQLIDHVIEWRIYRLNGSSPIDYRLYFLVSDDLELHRETYLTQLQIVNR